jgi:branched-chain amino acid transport system substrate-binding protein
MWWVEKEAEVTRRCRVGMLAVLVVAAMFFVAGCAGGEQGGGEASGPTATIVSDLPLEQRDYMAGDVRINYVSQDDATAQDGKWTEARCAENAQSAAQNEEIVGWIGPYNSGCAAVEIPILNQAGLAMVSHGNTAVGLTKPGGDPDEPEKYYPTGQRNYARVIVADDKQGRGGAVWMRDEGVQRVYILDDRETYGKGIADQFEQNAQQLGIQVLGHEGIDGSAPNYRALMQKIAQLNPDAIYFGGITDNNAAQLINDKVGAGMSNRDVIFMGPDGILEEAFAKAAGDAGEGVYATFAGLPASELPGKGQDFVQNKGPTTPTGRSPAMAWSGRCSPPRTTTACLALGASTRTATPPSPSFPARGSRTGISGSSEPSTSEELEI